MRSDSSHRVIPNEGSEQESVTLRTNNIPLGAAIAVLIVHGIAVLRLGISVPPDSVKFSQWADLLIVNRFNFAAVIRAAGSHNVPTGMYMLFATAVALAKLVAGANWASILVAANLLCDAIAAAILVRLVFLATRSSKAALFSGAAWLLCFDIVTWVRMPLTDVPFLLASLAAFASLAAPILAGKELTRKAVMISAFLTTVAILMRPVGFLWIPLVAAGYLVLSGRLARRGVIVTALLVAALAFAAHTFVVRSPALWPFETFAKGVQWDARSYRLGEVITQRPELSHRPPSSIIDYAAISADRFAHFFAPMTASFSRAHKIAGIAFYCPLYLLAIAAVIAAGVRRGKTADVVILSAVVVLTVAFWHSLVVIDYDWRYRLPVLPHLIFLAACALPLLRGRFQSDPV